jgi:hypothetical protein
MHGHLDIVLIEMEAAHAQNETILKLRFLDHGLDSTRVCEIVQHQKIKLAACLIVTLNQVQHTLLHGLRGFLLVNELDDAIILNTGRLILFLVLLSLGSLVLSLCSTGRWFSDN